MSPARKEVPRWCDLRDHRAPLVGTLLRGTPPTVARRTGGDMPLPPDFRQGYTSIYELQTETKR